MWDVITTDKFDEWFDYLSDTDRANVIAGMLLLKEKGPHLSRPFADTVKGSKYPNKPYKWKVMARTLQEILATEKPEVVEKAKVMASEMLLNIHLV